MAVEKRLWLDLVENPFGRNFGRVLDIAPRPDDDGFVVATAQGILWISYSGNVEDYVDLGGSRRNHSDVRVLSGSHLDWAFAAIGGGRLGFFDRQGALKKSVPARETAMIAVGDMRGGTETEILLAPGDGEAPRVVELTQTKQQAIQVDGYVTGINVADVDGDGKAEAIVYTYPHGDRRGRFHVVDPVTETSHVWEQEAVGSDFGILEDEHGVERVVLATKQGFEYRDFDGNVTRVLDAPGADKFRRVRGMRLDAHLEVIVASGGGYVPYHMICVYRDGALVYQEVLEGRSHAMRRLPGDDVAFLLAVDERIVEGRVTY